jgi:hypothetical protein
MITKQLLRGREIEPETCKIEDHAVGGKYEGEGEKNASKSGKRWGQYLIFPRCDFDGERIIKFTAPLLEAWRPPNFL